MRLPSRKFLLLYVALSIPVGALFLFVYGAANRRADELQAAHDLYLSWEPRIPFVPWFIAFYFSLNFLMWIPLFIFRSAREYYRLAAAFILATLVAGAVFYLYPTRLGYTRIGDQTSLGPVFAFLYEWDRVNNCFPSLHVAFSGIIVLMIWPLLERTWKRAAALWLALIWVSTLLVHQHHLADIVGGAFLAFMSVRLVRRFDGFGREKS
jgi:membrane-associated phospholipid phosphatase